MTEMISYLSNFREETPEWITQYLCGEQITFKDVMSSRVGYYPGSGDDGTLMKVGNKSHSVHSFLYVDYIERNELEEQIVKEDSFLGYHSVGKMEWHESDIMPRGQHQILKPTPNSQETPYCFSIIMERDEDRDDAWGAKHFVITFLCGNSIDVYYWLFKKEYSKAPWIFLLNERYKGGSFERYQSSYFYPQFVIFDKNAKIWEGYDKVENVSPVFGEFWRRRDLYERENQGTVP